MSVAIYAYLRAILPLRAKEIAFINSVVFGTSANRVTPRNFSSMPEPCRTTSTTSTRISVEAVQTINNYEVGLRSPAIIAYRAVQVKRTAVLVPRVHDGAS